MQEDEGWALRTFLRGCLAQLSVGYMRYRKTLFWLDLRSVVGSALAEGCRTAPSIVLLVFLLKFISQSGVVLQGAVWNFGSGHFTT